MPWIVGIDEAGYGPNLGPLVMTSVACRVPEPLAAADLWQVLREAVRRQAEPDDGRLLIEDSKVVYSTARGLRRLEHGVLAALPPRGVPAALTLTHYLDRLCPASHPELRGEPWYTGSSSVPVLAEPAQVEAAAQHFAQVSAGQNVTWGPIRSVVICPARFNQLLDHWGSKGAVLAHAFTELVAANQRPEGDTEAVCFFIDKHGGRNAYSAMLQNALAGGMVVARAEGPDRSVYQVLGLPRPVWFTFQPRADAEHFCVALASMVSKYLREVLMLEFNHFWRTHLPDLKPTAGYPGDADRFFQAIRSVADRLNIPETVLWRRK